MVDTKLILGDCLDVMRGMDDNSVDAVVTDPPYGLSFMGKKWDYDVPSVEIWQECLRVLKPGGHLLAFAGTRTQHRMACRIEDAGFEIRDMLAWVYSTGFPKSLNVGKAVDKLQGNEREWVSPSPFQASEEAELASTGKCQSGRTTHPDITKGSSPWEGWGTSLKPAFEPVTVARKPFTCSVAENVLKWGTGGINVDATRIGTRTTNESGWSQTGSKASENRAMSGANYDRQPKDEVGTGRFPANLCHDGSDEVMRLFPNSKSTGGTNRVGDPSNIYANGNGIPRMEYHNFGDTGSAARFFYCAKSSKRERNEGLEGFEAVIRNDGRGEELTSGNMPQNRSNNPKQNHHATVKPVSLMRWLCRLVTRPGGIVLDPFMGSGSTGIGCVLEGFNFIGIEREQDYYCIADARIAHWKNKAHTQPELFGETDG